MASPSLILPGAVVVGLLIGGQQRVDGVRALERSRQKRHVGYIAREDLGAGAREFRELGLGPAERADLVASFKQRCDDLAAGVPRRSQYRNHGCSPILASPRLDCLSSMLHVTCGSANAWKVVFMLDRPGRLDGGACADYHGAMHDPWMAVDPLGEALHFLRMSGVFYSRSEFTAPWGLELPPMADCLMFHVVTSGRCWLEVDGAELRLLQPGELALVPHGQGHRLVSEPGVPAVRLFDLPHEYLSERYEILRQDGGGALTNLICGVVRFEHPAAQQLVRLLPRVISVEAWNASELEWIPSTLRLLAAEARELRPGGETVITRLADILVIQAIRWWIAHDPAAQTGWLGALQDQQIGRAIALIHREPERPWTVSQKRVVIDGGQTGERRAFLRYALIGLSGAQGCSTSAGRSRSASAAPRHIHSHPPTRVPDARRPWW